MTVVHKVATCVDLNRTFTLDGWPLDRDSSSWDLFSLQDGKETFLGLIIIIYYQICYYIVNMCDY